MTLRFFELPHTFSRTLVRRAVRVNRRYAFRIYDPRRMHSRYL